jgi:hypothetical protein
MNRNSKQVDTSESEQNRGENPRRHQNQRRRSKTLDQSHSPHSQQRKDRSQYNQQQQRQTGSITQSNLSRRQIIVGGAGVAGVLAVVWRIFSSSNRNSEYKDLIRDGRVNKNTAQISVDAENSQTIQVDISGPYAESREAEDPLPSSAEVQIKNSGGEVLREDLVTAPEMINYETPRPGTYVVEIETVNLIDSPSRDPVETIDYQVFLIR